MRKIRIEVEKIDDSGRPFEWRVWTREPEDEFGDQCDVSGSKRTMMDAIEEAVYSANIDEGPVASMTTPLKVRRP